MNRIDYLRRCPGYLGPGMALAGIALLISLYPNPFLAVSLVFAAVIMAFFLVSPRSVILFFLLIRSSLDITKQVLNVYLTETFQITAPIAVSLLLILGGGLYILVHRIEIFKIPLTGLLALFLAIAIINFPMSEDFLSGLTEFLRFFSSFILFILVWTLFDDRKRAKVIIRVIILSSLIPIGVGIYQAVLNRGQFISGYIRTYGTFVHPNPYAFFLVIILALSLNLYFLQSRWRNRIFLVGLIIPAVFCLLLTFTRSAWFGLFLIFIILIWFRGKKFIWPFLVLAAAFILLSPIRARFYDLSTSFNSITHRFFIWKGGLEKLPACPLIGRGLASFALLDPHGQQAHNDYLRILFELGIPGLLVYLALILSVLWRLKVIIGDRADPYLFSLACATGSVFLVFQMAGLTGNILFRPAIQWYLWALLAVVLRGAEEENKGGWIEEKG